MAIDIRYLENNREAQMDEYMDQLQSTVNQIEQAMWMSDDIRDARESALRLTNWMEAILSDVRSLLKEIGDE